MNLFLCLIINSAIFVLPPRAKLRFPVTVFKVNPNMDIFLGIVATTNMEMYQEINRPESEM
jgi:hypothetical protein